MVRPINVVTCSFVLSVARQRPINNIGVVFSLGSVLRTHCRREHRSLNTT
jgi:hypothetical protein